MKLTLILVLSLLAFTAAAPQARIVGGETTTIDKYPFMVSMLFFDHGVWAQRCGGTIINNRSILSSGHCLADYHAREVQGRVGSTQAHSGGTVLNAAEIFMHRYFHIYTYEYDISIIRVTTAIQFGTNIAAAKLAGANYQVPAETGVMIAGWGQESWVGSKSENLKHVEIYTISLEVCRTLYFSWLVTDEMICAGNIRGGGRGSCVGDSGGPMLHNGVVTGIISWGQRCGDAQFPCVFTSVPAYIGWIQERA